MRFVKGALILSAIAVAVLVVAYGVLGYAPAPKTVAVEGTFTQDSIRVGQRQRQFTTYIPETLQANAPLVFVLHGSLQAREDIRHYTGYGFERLAEQHGFVVVYPQGYRNNWNDCRSEASYPAKTENVDDLGFIQAVVDRLIERQMVDPDNVFLMGFSNGGHLGFRFALEKPGVLAGIAAVSASLPKDESIDCEAVGEGSAVLIMNGTADPINPYDGGRVTLFGFGDRGTVMSSEDSADYFAGLLNYAVDDATSQTSVTAAGDRVVETRWHGAGKPEVLHYSIGNGGHVVPNPDYRAPRILGKTHGAVNGPQLIWEFFSRQMTGSEVSL